MKNRTNVVAAGQLILRLALGAGFILPVLDRLGVLGPAGTEGVAWGNWSAFVGYTRELMPFHPASLAPFGAVIVTGLEILFGICLAIGWKVPVMATGAGILTFLFGICMILSKGIAAPFNYPVFVFTGGALLLAGTGHYRWSVDSALGNNSFSKTTE